MPLTHEYPRFLADSRFGITASSRCNIVCCSTSDARQKALCVCGAGEDAIVWNANTGQAVRKFREEDDDEELLRPRVKAGAVVTRLAVHAGSDTLAVGCSDGWIRLYCLRSGELQMKFCGHKHAITALAFHATGDRLAAAGSDSDVTVLRIESESGFRLQGHTNSVTQVEFIDDWPIDCLLSASKDGLIKFWNVALRACFKTLTGHPGEVWDFAVMGRSSDWNRILVTGSCDNQLRVWRLKPQVTDEEGNEDEQRAKRAPAVEEQVSAVIDLEESVHAEFMGTVPKAAAGRVHTMNRITHRLLTVTSNTKSFELFAIPAERQLKLKLRQRQKKATKRGLEKSSAQLQAGDLLRSAGQLAKFPAKVRCVQAFGAHRLQQQQLLEEEEHPAVADQEESDSSSFLLFASMNNNSVYSYHVSLNEEQIQVSAQGPSLRHGHREATRCSDVSSDSSAILTASATQLKLWHFASLSCVLSIDCPPDAGHITRCHFLPGDRYAACGTTAGRLLLCDLGDSRVFEQIAAHDAGHVTCMSRLANASGLVTASAEEKRALQWRFEIVKSGADVSSKLGLLLSREISLSDGVVAVCHSSDSRLLCLSLLDNSVRILFFDTAREFLHLHGHSQPISSMSISYDCTILATGSGDRTVRIWGLQFGDCQRVFRAHDLAVNCVAFLPKKLLLLTASADSTLKLWDAKKFKRITTLHGHQAAIAHVSIAPNAEFFASVDNDCSVRTWRLCEEPLVIEEEREFEKEAQYEEELNQQQEAPADAAAGLLSRISLESVKGAEKLIEIIEIFESEMQRRAEGVKTAAHPAVISSDATSPQQFFAQQLGKMQLHDMEQSVLALPTVFAQRLLHALQQVAADGLQPEKVARCVSLCLSFHCPQLVGNESLRPMLQQLQGRMAASSEMLNSMVGFNLAAMRISQRLLESQEQVGLFAEAAGNAAQAKKKRKSTKKKTAFVMQKF